MRGQGSHELEKDINQEKISEIHYLSEEINSFVTEIADAYEISLPEVQEELKLICALHKEQYEKVLLGEEIEFYSVSRMPNLYKLVICLKNSVRAEAMEEYSYLYDNSKGHFIRFIEESTSDELALLLEKSPYAGYFPMSADYNLPHFYTVFSAKDAEKFKVLFCQGGVQPAFYCLQYYDAFRYIDPYAFWKQGDRELVKHFYSLLNGDVLRSYMQDNDSSMGEFLKQLRQELFYSRKEDFHILDDFDTYITNRWFNGRDNEGHYAGGDRKGELSSIELSISNSAASFSSEESVNIFQKKARRSPKVSPTPEELSKVERQKTKTCGDIFLLSLSNMCSSICK